MRRDGLSCPLVGARPEGSAGDATHQRAPRTAPGPEAGRRHEPTTPPSVASPRRRSPSARATTVGLRNREEMPCDSASEQLRVRPQAGEPLFVMPSHLIVQPRKLGLGIRVEERLELTVAEGLPPLGLVGCARCNSGATLARDQNRRRRSPGPGPRLTCTSVWRAWRDSNPQTSDP